VGPIWDRGVLSPHPERRGRRALRGCVWRQRGLTLPVHLGSFFQTETGRNFIGAGSGSAEMRVATPSNRLRGELILQRVSADAGTPLLADFVIYAQPNPGVGPRYERWRGQVNLPAGARVAVAPYEIDSSGMPTLFTLDIPPESAGRLIAGWANPTITDVGRDSPAPAWLSPSVAPITVLDEQALARLLPTDWRPVQALMRGGRVTPAGIELSAGAEIWIQVRGIVSRFIGTARPLARVDRARASLTRSFWYKAGRFETYLPPVPANKETGVQFFQAWCGEPGGWLVIAAYPHPETAPVLVHVTEVNVAR
jgi:hypothetical protein